MRIDRNILKASGTVVSARSGKTRNGIDYTAIRVITDGGGNRKDMPLFTFYNDPTASEIQRGDRVDIVGHGSLIRIPASQDQGKARFNFVFVGDKIRKTPRDLAQYVEFGDVDKYDGGFSRDVNEALIAGQVAHIFEAVNGLVIITVSVRNETSGRFDYVNLSCFRRQGDYARKLEKGDSIICTGLMETSYLENERRTLQNIVARDLSKIASEDNKEEAE